MLDMIENSTVATIRAIIFREGDLWVAQCVEYDIGCQAPTLAELTQKLMVTVELECVESMRRHGAPFRGIPPAPDRYEAMWRGRPGLFVPIGNDTQNKLPVQKAGTELELALCA